MKKEGIILPILLIALLSFVSAYNGYGFSIGEFFDSIDQSTLVLSALFLIFFAVLFFILSKFFKDKHGEPNKAIAGVVAFCISLLIIYGIHNIGLDVEDLIYSIGINEETLSVLVPLILILGFLFLLWKIKSKVLLIFGGLFIAIALFTDWVYEKETLFIIGMGFVIVWILWKFVFKKIFKKKPKITGSYDDFDRIDRKELDRERQASADERRYKQELFNQRRKDHRAEAMRRVQNIAQIKRDKEKKYEKIRRRQQEMQMRVREYQNRYNQLKAENKILFERNRGIPPRGTSDGERRYKNIEMMKQIEDLAKKYGFNL